MPSTKAANGSITAELSPPQNDIPRSLTRSPHPYHRRSLSLKTPPKGLDDLRNRGNESSDSTESEERGTEADDEKGPILKGLPAPPLRGRKGLKGSKTPADLTPAISPVPTPPALDDRRPSYFATDRSRKSSKSDNAAREDAIEAYKRYVKRRRTEIARRSTESGLLAFIALATWRHVAQDMRFKKVLPELLSSFAVFVLLCVAFPIRIAYHRYRRGVAMLSALKAGFHIPSRFDPGSLLYPVFLPTLICISLFPVSPKILITNVILGLSSIPQKVIPFGNGYSFGSVNWLLSLTPLFRLSSTLSTRHATSIESDDLGLEELVLLFPLHEALLATLKYLTSTSLDPAEIQLLSTGLINLLLFTTYPQAEILKALLWGGGLCLFILCRIPLSWEVRIARIPSWKFARNKSPQTGLFKTTETLLDIILPHHPYKQSRSVDSDDEDYEYLKSARRMAKNAVRMRRIRSSAVQSDLEPILSDKENAFKQANGDGVRRSLTTTANGVYHSSSLRRRKRSLTIPTTGFHTLTYNQAQACKWLIAGYVFSVVASVILLFIRQYVGMRALSSHEPFGWAVGYLFGNIQPLRFWIVSNNLDSWISLPGHTLHNLISSDSGWVEILRQNRFGPANVRLGIAGYCLVVLAVGISIVLQLGKVVEVDTRRKVFHGIMVAMLLPTIFIDPCFIALALTLILAIFILLDLFRASQLPPISKPLTTFLAPYVDGRDYRGPVVVSHMFLLVGCAIPLWLSLAGMSRTGEDPWFGWDTNTRDLSMISGVVCVGMGDSAASLIGRRYGRTKWFWGGGKSLEGSGAFILAVTCGLALSYIWLRVGGWVEWDSRQLPIALMKMVVAGSGASILESVLTAGNDNVIVPIGLWLLTRGLQI